MSNYNDKEIYEVNNITVSTLLSNIREGIIAIPEIQRPFVWKTSQVRDLLDSLYKNYPIGYLIVWNNPKTRLKDGSLSQVLNVGVNSFTTMCTVMLLVFLIPLQRY